MTRRTFLKRTAAGAAAVAWTQRAWSAPNDLDRIRAEIEKRHDESVRRLQEWIYQPSIAAENRGVSEGCDLAIRLLREAGFDRATRVPTDGQPGIFATLDAGAPRTTGLYFMSSNLRTRRYKGWMAPCFLSWSTFSNWPRSIDAPPLQNNRQRGVIRHCQDVLSQLTGWT